jgi:tetratricopeptide (TPR) repeat protein
VRKARAILLLNSSARADHAVALGELQSLAQADPGSPAVIFQLGRAYALTGSEDKARQQFETLLQKDPSNVSALLALAELHSTSKHFQQSLVYSGRILAIEPTNRNARLLHATALVGLGRLDLARNEYRGLVRDEPGFVEAQLQLAMLFVVGKQFTEAEKLFRQLYRPKAADFRALKGLVEVNAAQGQWTKALELLNSELGKYPDAIPVRALLASTAVRAGNLDLAVEQYERMLQRGGENLEVLTELGQLYQRRHELSKSLAMLQQARNLAPGDWRTAARLGTVQQEAGLRPESRSSYEQAVRLGGDDGDLLNNLAYLEADMGSNLDDALALARRALSKDPGNSQYADTVGFIYFKKRDFASSLEVFQKLSQRYPNDGPFRYHLALALVESGRREQGERELRAAIAADPALANQSEVRSLLGGKQPQPAR